MRDTSWWIAAFILGIALVVGAVGFWVILQGRSGVRRPRDQVKEITLTRGDVSLTLTREGMLTVRIPEGVFVQEWDEERVRRFFAQFESEDLSIFLGVHPAVSGYTLVVRTASGGEATYLVPFSFDISLPQAIGELIETLEQLASAYAASAPAPTPALFPTGTTVLPTPTLSPVPRVVIPTPTRVPPRDGGGGVVQKLFECDFSEPATLPDVLSQTVCTIISAY